MSYEAFLSDQKNLSLAEQVLQNWDSLYQMAIARVHFFS